MVRKIFFCSEFPVIPEKWGEKKKKGNYDAFCFSSKRNKKIVKSMYEAGEQITF